MPKLLLDNDLVFICLANIYRLGTSDLQDEGLPVGLLYITCIFQILSYVLTTIWKLYEIYVILK